MLLAAKGGASYVSLFIRRFDYISSDGLTLIADIRKVNDYNSYETKIFGASIRHTMHVFNCAIIGDGNMTRPFSSSEGLLKRPLIDSGLEKFKADYQKSNSQKYYYEK